MTPVCEVPNCERPACEASDWTACEGHWQDALDWAREVLEQQAAT